MLAGLEALPVGARSLGMAGTYVAVANTADAVFLNPAGLSLLEAPELSLFYQKPFGLAELNYGAVSVSFPLAKRQISLGMISLGNRLYKEQAFTLAYSHHYQKKLYYGISVNFQRIQISNYGTDATLGLDVGLLVPFTSRITWGFQTKNLNRPQIGQTNENLPQIFKTGISTAPYKNVLLTFELCKDVRFPVEARFGTEIKLRDRLALRLGTASHPSRFAAGFGLTLRQFTVDYAFFTHNDLGLTHQMSVSIRFNKKSPEWPEEPVVAIQPQVLETPELPEHAKSENDSLSIAAKINLNVADKGDLMRLPGIGEVLAQAILDYRLEKGAFQKIAELLLVPGIGKKIFIKIRGHVFVEQKAGQ